ncbi:nucleotide exchange factor GrpE [bacterium]|nr:nucleotide exchange factor GrpE [bacterium]
MSMRGNPGPLPVPPLASLRRRKKYQLRRRSYASQPVTLAADDSERQAELERLRDLVHQLETQMKEAQDNALRARADVENQRRRHQKDKEELRKYATEDLMRSLVAPMDHFGLAMLSLETASNVDSVRQGVEMIHREIVSVLQGAGLELIQPTGQQFDPNLHEAAATETQPDQPEGVVLETMRPGWALKGRVIRPAMVSVNKIDGPTPTPEG